MPIKITQLPKTTAINANSSNNLLVVVDLEEPLDTLKTKKITVEDFLRTTREAGDVQAMYYVQPMGSDNSAFYDGKSWDRAFKTVEHALTVSSAWQANNNNLQVLIEIGPGIYETEGHIDMPDNTIVKSTHRTAIFRPKVGFEKRNVFRMGSGCFLEGLLFEDFQLDDLDDPTEGFAVSFRPGAVIRRVPYAHKIAVRTTPTWSYIAPPLDRDATPEPNPLVGRGAGVCLADGDVCSPYSIFPNIMTWGATPVTHNGIGYCAKNGGLINAVNAVSMWAHKHFYALSGGQIILSACSTQFGDYTMVSKGYRNLCSPLEVLGVRAVNPIPLSNVVITTPQTANATLSIQTSDASTINVNSNTIVTNMWNYLVSNGYTTGWTSTDETYTKRDASNLIHAYVRVLQTSNESYATNFARGLFWANGNSVIETSKRSAFNWSFDEIKRQIINLPGLNTTSKNIVSELTTSLKTTIAVPSQKTVTLNVQNSSATIISTNIDTIANDTWTALMTEGYGSVLNGVNDQAYTIRDAKTLMNSIVRCLQTGTETRFKYFINGLFFADGNKVYSSDKQLAFLYSFDYIRDRLKTLTGVTNYTKSILDGLFNCLTYTLRYPTYTSVLIKLDVHSTSANIIASAANTIINNTWQYLVDESLTIGWTTDDETYTKRDTQTLLQSLIWVLQTTNEKPMLDFAKALYDTTGTPVFSSDKAYAFVYSYDYIRDSINSLVGMSEGAKIIVTCLIESLKTSIINPQFNIQPSLITAIGHTWTAVLGGVALTKIPPVLNEAKITDSILELNQGIVIASGQDDQGSALFVGGMTIDSDTGELAGPPFQSAVNRIANKTVIARSF